MKLLDFVQKLRVVVGFEEGEDERQQFFSQFFYVGVQSHKDLDDMGERPDHLET